MKPNRSTRFVLGWLALIVVLGTTLRLYRLDYQSLWNDELSSWARSNHETVSEVVRLAAQQDVHPPAYHALLFYVERHLGDSEWWLRFPSAVFGVLAIVIVFLIGRQIYSDREGLFAALLMAVMWCPIYYSQEARMYSLLILATITAMLFWLRLAGAINEQTPVPPTDWAGYVLSAGLSCYSHYYGLVFVALQAAGLVAMAIGRRRLLLRLLGAYSIIALIYLPWVRPTLDDLLHHSLKRQRPGADYLWDFWLFLFNKSMVVSGIAAAVLLAFLVKALLSTGRTGRWRALFASPTLLVSAWLVLPVAVTFLKSWVSEPTFVNRYLLISMPAAYLLLARAFTRLPTRQWISAAGVLAFAGLALYNLVIQERYYTAPSKAQFREAVAHVVERHEDFPDSMVAGWTWSRSYLDYYFERLGSRLRVKEKAGTLEELAPLNQKIDRVDPEYLWLIAAHREPEPAFLSALESRYELIDTRELRRASVRLYRTSVAEPELAAAPAPPEPSATSGLPPDPKPQAEAPESESGFTPAKLRYESVFLEVDGRVAIEAEDFAGRAPGTGRGEGASWEVSTGSGVGGRGFVDSLPNTGVSVGDRTAGARLDYPIDFARPGTYYVWLRMLGRGGQDDSVHVGLDGVPATYGGRGIGHDGDEWSWHSEISGAEGGRRAQIVVETPGLHYFNLWVREDGTAVDQILLRQDGEVVPSGIVATEPPGFRTTPESASGSASGGA